MLEKAWVCKNCKITVCKKCIKDMDEKLQKDHSKESKTDSPETPPLQAKCPGEKMIKLKKLYAIHLSELTNDDIGVPVFVNKMIHCIRWTNISKLPGFYRKAPQMQQKNHLKDKLNKDPVLQKIKLENWKCEPHVLSACLKDFFRELPDPLLKTENYEPIVRIGKKYEGKDKKEHEKHLMGGLKWDIFRG